MHANTGKQIAKHDKWPNTSTWQKMYVTHWNEVITNQAKGKIQRALLVTKGWMSHDLTLPWEYHYLFMRCQTQRGKTGIGRCAETRIFLPLLVSKCLNLHYVSAIHFPSDLLLFIWSGPPPGSSGRGYYWCPAGEVTAQHSLHTLSVRSAWRVSKCPTDQTRSHAYVIDKSQVSWTKQIIHDVDTVLHSLLAIPCSRFMVATWDLLRTNTCWSTDKHWTSAPCSVPLPPAGELRVRDVTHSTMKLNWDAAPGPVRKYLITYKPEEGEAKEVS